MHRRISAVVLLAFSCAAGNASSQVAPPQAAPGTSRASGLDYDIISNAIAGPLIHVIAEQVGDRAVAMKLDAIDVDDRAVSGTGGVQIDGKGSWIAFRFQMPYSSRGAAGYPQVSIAGVATDHDIPNDARLVRRLEADMAAKLVRELRKPSTWLRLDRISTVEGGNRLLRINAEGIAYFDREGHGTPLTIEALYDRSSNSWRRLAYGLGDSGMPAAKSIVRH
jgi:hypothetical protein